VQADRRFRVHLGHQFLAGGALVPRERVEHAALAPQPVPDEVADLAVRVADEVAVPRRDDREFPREQRLERREIRAHVAVRRIDDHRRALHDVVAGEEHLRVFEQVAQVIRRVPRRVQRGERDAGDREALAVRGLPVRREGRVLRVAGRCRVADHLRARRLLQRTRRRRVIAMRVRAEDPANAPATRVEDRRDVPVERRARVDHRDLVLADEVGVGPRPGHLAGIRRDEARDEPIEALRHTGDDVVARLRRLARVAPVDLVVRRIAVPEHALALGALRDRDAIGRDVLARPQVRDLGVDAWEAA
jgi:hypothetical protein